MHKAARIVVNKLVSRNSGSNSKSKDGCGGGGGGATY